MTRKITVHEESVNVEFFGRFDLRLNRLIKHLYATGQLDSETDKAFAESIGRMPQTVNFWRNLLSFPNSVSLMKIAKKHDVSLDWMVGLKGNTLEYAFRSKKGPKHLALVA